MSRRSLLAHVARRRQRASVEETGEIPLDGGAADQADLPEDFQPANDDGSFSSVELDFFKRAEELYASAFEAREDDVDDDLDAPINCRTSRPEQGETE